jgi:hypothetical protein
VQAPGGGPKKLAETDPELTAALKALVDPATRGDPMSLLVWMTKSTKKLAGALSAMGHRVSRAARLGGCFETWGSPAGQHESRRGSSTRGPDVQFGYLNATVAEHVWAGQPVVWGRHQEEEAGRGMQERGPQVPAGGATRTRPRPRLPGQGTFARPFAVATLRRWWETIGTDRYPAADRLLVCADGGGSTGDRIWAWKIELAELAGETGLAITVCYFPARDQRVEADRTSAVLPDHHARIQRHHPSPRHVVTTRHLLASP